MKKKPSQRMTYVTPGFHSDVVWLEDQRDYAMTLMNDVSQNLQIARFDPDYGVFLHELTYLKPYIDTHPEDRAFILELIRKGRIGTGGSHSEPSETIVSGESLIRNIMYGRFYHEGVLGDRPEIYMPWDVFGHCAQLAQILKKSRFRGCIWSKQIFGAPAVFWHIAPDGSRLLFRRTLYAFGDWDSRSEKTFMESLESSYPEMASFGLSADLRVDALDFKPPAPFLVGKCGEYKKQKHAVVINGTAHRQWFRLAHREIKHKKLMIPMTARDFEWHHQGTGLSRIDFKQSNRIAENTLIEAEKWATLASLLGAKYPDRAIDKAWRQLLFNQHHDGITGACCDRAFIDLMLGFREAVALASEARGNALKFIASKVGSKKKAPQATTSAVHVFNSLNWPRTEPVTFKITLAPNQGMEMLDEEGNFLPVQVRHISSDQSPDRRNVEFVFIARDVPPMGFSTYYIRPAAALPESIEPKAGVTVENGFYRLTVDATHGGIVSLFDKEHHKEIIKREAGPANELVALAEDPARRQPPWEVFTTGPKHFSRDYPASCKVTRGPVFSTITVEGEFVDCRRRQEIIMYHDVPGIDFETHLLEYKGEHHLFVASFPVDVRGAQPVFEDRFCATVKRKSKGKFDFRVCWQDNISECGARRAHQWVDMSCSAKLSFGADVSFALGMVSVIHTHDTRCIEQVQRLADRLIRKGVPVTPYFDDCDMQRRKNLPKEETLWPKPKEFNRDLAYGTSFRISVDTAGDNIYTQKILKSLPVKNQKKFAEKLDKDGFATVFALNTELPEGWPPLPVLVVSSKNAKLLEKTVDRLLATFSADATIHLPPESNLTGLDAAVEDYGVSLLNTGNVLYSTENDDSLVLFLIHTAAWADTPWGKDRLPFLFIPEHKTHHFRYALYPHVGDWRHAQVYRRGYEYNNPLDVVVSDVHGGTLAPSQSLLQVEGDSLVVTALKPGDNPTAAFRDGDVDIKKGLVIRLYEAEGRSANTRISFFRDLRKCFVTNCLEENEKELKLDANKKSSSVEIGGFAIETFRVIPKDIDKSKNVILAPEKEDIPVLHFKHWDHNTGAEPLGYAPVAICLKGEVKTEVPIVQGGFTVNTVSVSVSNNFVDRRFRGVVELIPSAGWRTVPAEIAVNLGPGETLTRDVLLSFEEIMPFGPNGRSPRKKGMLKARIDVDGQIYQDVLEAGGESKLNCSVSRNAGGITVNIENPNDDPVEGAVAVASPIETWSPDEVGPLSALTISPMQKGFSIAPHTQLSLIFALEGEYGGTRSLWAMVKLMYNGKVEYIPVPGTTAVESI